MLRLGACWAVMLMIGSPTLLADDSAGDSEKTNPIQRLAELRLDERLVPARMINLPIPGRTRTLQDVLDRLQDWSEDDAIGEVLLDIGNVRLGMPDVMELRDGIQRVRDSGKRVSAFVNGTGQLGYLLACAADEIVVPPCGGVSIPGLGAMFMFMKGYYQRIGLEFDVIAAGRFKYPGFLNEREPNKYFKEEYGFILDGLFHEFKKIIADGRNMPEEKVVDAINQGMFSPEEAEQHGLVDRISYYDEYVKRILSLRKLKKHRSSERGLANVNSLQDFMELINGELQAAEDARSAVGPKIAVLHARGPIIDVSMGAGLASQVISRDDFVKVVDQLRKNRSIKAVVMRIDSPGGSAYASDVIWKSLRVLNETKPLVVSMGTVAGSGGYYIACPARRIFAQPATITGSIGVLSIFQCAASNFNRLDYNVATMNRGDRALMGSPHREMSKEDRAFFSAHTEKIYDMFISRVAQGRKMPASEVREIAEGRIYTGRQGLDIGLVDELGGLNDAIDSAREMAGIPESAELKILHYPRPSSLGELFETLGSVGMQGMAKLLSHISTPAYPVSFEEQVQLFTRQPRPLCWMAMPDFAPVSGSWNSGLRLVPAEILGSQPVLPLHNEPATFQGW